MIIPGKTVCDFCGSEIVSPYTTINVPMPPSVHRELVTYYEAEITRRMQTSPFSGIFPVMVPDAVKLVQCLACTAAGVMPDVLEKITTIVRDEIDRRIATARRARASLAAWEPESKETES